MLLIVLVPTIPLARVLKLMVDMERAPVPAAAYALRSNQIFLVASHMADVLHLETTQIAARLLESIRGLSSAKFVFVVSLRPSGEQYIL